MKVRTSSYRKILYLSKVIILTFFNPVFIIDCGGKESEIEFPEPGKYKFIATSSCNEASINENTTTTDRMFKVTLYDFPQTREAMVIGNKAMVVPESKDKTSDKFCYYISLTPGKVYNVYYITKSKSELNTIRIGFAVEELGEKGVYSVIEQHCGNKFNECHFRDHIDWLNAIKVDKGFNDPCSNTKLLNIRAYSTILNQRFIEAILNFELLIKHEKPRYKPNSPEC